MMMTKQKYRFFAVMIACCMIMMQCLLLPAKIFADTQPDFSVLGAIGDFTEEETQTIAQRIYEGLESHSSTISLRGGSMPTIPSDEAEALGSIYRSVIAGWDIGILTLKNQMTYQMQSEGIIAIVPTYLVEEDVYDATYADLMLQLDAAVSGVQSDWSDAEKALYLHEWMAMRFDYDSTTYETDYENNIRHTAYGALLRGSAVCEGYTWLYGLLLRRVGIESLMVSSVNLNHAWNIVQVDDAWYHVDVTWDDCYDTHPGLLQHRYLLRSHDVMMSGSHEAEDWELVNGNTVTDLTTSDRYDNAFWNDSMAAIQYCEDGTWMSIMQNADEPASGWFTKVTFDPATGTDTASQIMSLNDRWYLSRTGTTYYTNSFIVPAMDGDILYYTTPNSIMALKNGMVIWLMDLTEEQKEIGYLYGMYIEGDTLYYYVSKNVYAVSTEYSLDLTVYESYINEIVGETTPTESQSETTEPTENVTEPVGTTMTEETEATEDTTTSEETTVTEETTTSEETTVTEETTTSEETIVTEETTAEPTEETTEAPIDPTDPTENGYGDVNGDGIISILDLIAMHQYLMGYAPLSAENAQASDLTQDGVVDVFDLSLLKRVLLRKVSLQELLV